MKLNYLYLLRLSLGAVLLSGCGAEPQEAQPESQLAGRTEPVTLKIVYNSGWVSDAEFEKYFAEPVKKKYPHISFQVLDSAKKEYKIEQLMTAGITPDLVMSAGALIHDFMGKGLETDMEPLIKKHGLDLSKYNRAAVESVKTYSERSYLVGLPWTMHFNALYYNRDLFDKFGVAYPADGMTWEDARELARKLTRMDGGVQYRGLEPDQSPRVASALGLGIVNPKTGKAAVNSDGWKRVFELLKSIYDIPGNETPAFTSKGVDQFIKDRKLAMLASLNQIPRLTSADARDLSWDFAEYPSFREAPHVGMEINEWILHVTGQSRYQTEAFQAIAVVLSEEVQLDMARSGKLPVMTGRKLTDEFGKDIPLLQTKRLQSVFKSQPAIANPPSPYGPFAQPTMQNAILPVIKGEKDINTALREAEEAINRHIAEQTK